LRKERRWTQQHLARQISKLGWKATRGTVAKIECAELKVSDGDLLFLAKALKASIPDLFPTVVTYRHIKANLQTHRLMPEQNVFGRSRRRPRFLPMCAG